MRIIFIILLIFAFTLTACLNAFSAETTPKARIANPEVDFDKVEAGSEAVKTIMIENTGGSKLEITKLQSNSPSIVPSITDKVVEPGKSGEIQIKFDSKGIDPCVLVKYVYVYTNDPELSDRSIPVTCKAVVVPVSSPLIQLMPYEVDLGVVNVGETVTEKIQYKNVGTTDLEVDPVQYLDPQFKLTKNISTKKLAPGEIGSFEISFEAMAPGKIKSYLLVKSNTAGGPYSKVSLTGTVVAKNISIESISPKLDKDGKPETPEKYNIRFSNYFAPYKMQITVLNGTEKERVIEVPENSNRFDAIEIEASEGGKKISFQVDIIIEAPKPPVEEKKPAEGETTGVETTTEEKAKPETETKEPEEKKSSEEAEPAEEKKPAEETPPEDKNKSGETTDEEKAE